MIADIPDHIDAQGFRRVRRVENQRKGGPAVAYQGGAHLDAGEPVQDVIDLLRRGNFALWIAGARAWD